MLIINNKKLEITKQIIYVGKFTLNGEKGYNICINIEFNNLDNNKHGYIDLNAGFDIKNDINVFINREYKGIPFSDDNNYIYFEVYDTDNFFDTEIESSIIINIKSIIQNKVETYFELNDNLIKLKFDGFLDIISKF